MSTAPDSLGPSTVRGGPHDVTLRRHSSVIWKLSLSYARAVRAEPGPRESPKCELVTRVVLGELGLHTASVRYLPLQKELREWLRDFHRASALRLQEEPEAGGVRSSGIPDSSLAPLEQGSAAEDRADPMLLVRKVEGARRGAPREWSVSLVWPGRRGQPSGARWLSAAVAMALVICVAAWLGATVSKASAPSAETSVETATFSLGAAERTTYPLAVRADPERASISLDGVAVGSGTFATRLARDGAMHELRIVAPGFVPARVLFVDGAPSFDVQLEPMPVALQPDPAQCEREVARPVESVPQKPGRPRRGGLGRGQAARARAGVPGGAVAPGIAGRAVGAPGEPKRRPYVQIIEDGTQSRRGGQAP